jgi:cyclopropane fatty-acyl-phospholipid synthase-like methyltransferase
VGAPPPWDIGRPQVAFVRLAEAGLLSGELLDAGCGTGEHTILAASHGAAALGIDVSSRAIDAACRKARERSSGAAFEVLDAMAIGGQGRRFDTVIDSGLLHVFDDDARPRYVAALHGSLRAAGHLHLMCFSDQEPGDWGPTRMTEGALRALFGSGWRIESIAPARFEINAISDASTAEAWLLDVVRLPSSEPGPATHKGAPGIVS